MPLGTLNPYEELMFMTLGFQSYCFLFRMYFIHMKKVFVLNFFHGFQVI